MKRSPSLNAGSTLIFAVLLVVAMLASLRASAPPIRPAAVTSQVWEASADGAVADVLVLLEEQADLSAAADLSSPEERRRYVYERLRKTALRSQAALRAELDAAGVEYRSFYIVNMLALQGDRRLLTKLSARPEVARIVANPKVRQALPEPEVGASGLRPEAGIEWNVERVQADDVWTLGHTGEGVVVAGQDTGYDWEHPALIDHYRGYNGVTATHDYNWHDAIHTSGSDCGADAEVPCDDHGHGTHTMGTMVGDDGAGNQIGVAPGARWIGCRNMDEGIGSPETYIECFEFFLAPYPVGGDPMTEGEPSLAPDVINNSWTCPSREGCDRPTLQMVVENVRAAGILVVASAGNEGGTGCWSVTTPPAIYDAAYSVGATNRGDAIANFSSRGPATVTVDGPVWMKPDVSAPGVEVRSSVPGTGYRSKRGTSMAGPHVAGTAALLWSAAPWLIGDVGATEQVINRAARPQTTTLGCGEDTDEDVPNNVYGWGIVDALAAVEHAWLPIGGQAYVPPGLSPPTVRYTLTVTNMAPLTLTGVTIVDTLPLSTSLAWADEGYRRVGRTVSWTVPLLPPDGVLSRRLEVRLDDVPFGSVLVNDQYSVTADELSSSVPGWPTEALIPWRVILLPIYKGRAEGGASSG